MTTVLLVRHGESMANKNNQFAGSRSDVALQPRGLSQAELTAQYIAENFKVDKVYTSNLQRAYITGKCVADRFGLPVTVEPAFTEIDGGEWEGITFEEIPLQYPAEFDIWIHDYAHSVCPGGESVRQAGLRFSAAAAKAAEENDGKTILIATHATPVRIMIGLAQTGSLDTISSTPWPSNASVTVLEYQNGQWVCKAASLDDHLGELKTELPKNI